jgi:hypothetical protein
MSIQATFQLSKDKEITMQISLMETIGELKTRLEPLIGVSKQKMRLLRGFTNYSNRKGSDRKIKEKGTHDLEDGQDVGSIIMEDNHPTFIVEQIFAK